jgi:hypothetical protein
MELATSRRMNDDMKMATSAGASPSNQPFQSPPSKMTRGYLYNCVEKRSTTIPTNSTITNTTATTTTNNKSNNNKKQ